MFETVEAVRFDRMMTEGKTKPMLLACERADGSEVELVAKFQKGCGIGGLVREAFGSMFAVDLGLLTPEPFLVEVSDDFISSVMNPNARNALENCGGRGFGSKRLPNSYSQWIRDASMSASLEAEALAVVAFDCLITNGDRMVKRPNLLSDGHHIAVIDHELGFMTDLNMFWKEPWTLDALMNSRPPVDHVFHSYFRGRSVYDLQEVEKKLMSISNARLNEYYLALPPAWINEEAVGMAVELIRNLRNNALNAISETKKALI